MLLSTGLPAKTEEEAQRMCAVESDFFETRHKLAPGARRLMVERMANSGVSTTDDGGLEVRFDLPAGSYATVALAELFASVTTARMDSPD